LAALRHYLLAWYPRLTHATRKERENRRVIRRGEGIHWPERDKDMSIENIMIGRQSGENQYAINACSSSAIQSSELL